ncbi:hypothetical protein LTR93_011843 [Exophiala xenobiotica]|nr:hypothetical protein LTR93_011843 [Exophiala xenobiotica]
MAISPAAGSLSSSMAAKRHGFIPAGQFPEPIPAGGLVCPPTISEVPWGPLYDVFRTASLPVKKIRPPTLKDRRRVTVFPEDLAMPADDSLFIAYADGTSDEREVEDEEDEEAEEPETDKEQDDGETLDNDGERGNGEAEEAKEALATAVETTDQAMRIQALAAAQASSSLAAWNTEENFDRQQTQANDDLRAAELVNLRLGWVAFDVRFGKHTWSDGEFNREVSPDHVRTIVNSFSLSGCNRTRGDLPILAMTRKDYDDCLRYTANVLSEPYDSVSARAKDPDADRQTKHGDGVARTINVLLPLMLPPHMVRDVQLQPEVQAGHHRFVALREWSIQRNADGAKIDTKGRLDGDDEEREQVINLFAYGCYIVDKDRLYKNVDILRYARANRTDAKMQNSDGDTFRSIRTAWLGLNAPSREQIIKKEDPAFPLGFPQWIAYTTGTQVTAPQAQDRLKRVLTSARFSSLADSYCRFMWGRSSYTNTCWGKLMSASMPSWAKFFLTTHFNIHHKLFGEQCWLISDSELELLHQCFNWKELRFDPVLLDELFLPIEGESNHQNLKPPTPEEWTSTMTQCVIPEGNHAGRRRRHPRLLRLLAVPHYEKLLKRLKAYRAGPVLSGSMLAHLGSSIIPILSSFLHFIYYLYAPAGYLPSSNNSLETRSLDLSERLRPYCFPTKAEKDAHASSGPDLTMDLDDDDELEKQEDRMKHACTSLLYSIKGKAADWNRGESAIEAALAIKPEWRGNMNDEQKTAIFDLVSRETWMHPLIYYVFANFDLDQMVGVGAAMRAAYKKNIPFWADGKDEKLETIGTDLAQKFRSHPRAKCFPKKVRDEIVELQAPIFELFSVSVEYEAAITLLHTHYRFTQAEGYDRTKQRYSPNKDEIYSVQEFRQLCKLLKEYASRLFKLGLNNLLPRKWEDVKSCDLKEVCDSLIHSELKGSLNMAGFAEISRPLASKLLEGCVQPDNLADGDAWILKTKNRKKALQKSAFLVDPLDDGDDDESPAPPTNAASRLSSNTPAPTTPLPARGRKRPRDPSPTPPEPETPTPAATLSSAATPVAFNTKKVMGDYFYRGPAHATVTTGGIDDDRGNPFVQGNDIDACNQYHQDLYETLKPNAKGRYSKMLKLVRAQ